MIFVYFSKNRQIKEIITNSLPNTGNSNIDHIYCYWEDEDVIPNTSGVIAQLTREGISMIQEVCPSVKVGMELPETPERNLSYFSYEHTYEESGETHTGYLFYDVPLPDSLFVSFPTGVDTLLAELRLSIVSGTATYNFDLYPFTISVSGIILDGSINESQYQQLLKMVGTGSGIGIVNGIDAYSQTSGWNELAVGKVLLDITDKIFYVKLRDNPSAAPLYEVEAEYTQRYSINSILGYKDSVSSTELSKLVTDQIVVVNDTTNNVVKVNVKESGALSEKTVSKALGDKDGNAIDTTYLKRSGGQMTGDIDLNGKKIVKVPNPVGDYQVTNKRYTDAADTTLQNNIDAEAVTRGNADTGLQGQIDTHSTQIGNLQTEVQRIEDTKNIADIVGTKAQLDAYVVSSLAINDIIEVLADESLASPDTGATTMYRLTAKTGTVGTWSYIGKVNVPEGQLNNKYLRRDGSNSMNANLNVGSHAVEGVTMKGVTADTDGANVGYVKNKSFRVTDGTDTYDLYFDVSGTDGKLIGVKR